MARRVPVGAGMLAAALVVGACSGSGGAVSAGGQITGSAATNSGGSSSAGDTGASSSTGGSGTGGSSSNGGGGGVGDAGFTYTPWGPNDPPIPEQYAAFATASPQALNCTAVSDVSADKTFWTVATQICLALKGNGDWPATTAVPPPQKADNPYLDCLDNELASMLNRALRWHAANPGRTPVIRYPSRSSTSPCQSKIYALEVLPPSDPDSREGKVAVAVTAPPGKDNQLFVTVDGQPSDQNEVARNFLGDGLQRAVVYLDPPSQDRDAQVVVDNGRGTLKTTVHLTAASSGSPSGSPSPSASSDAPGSTSSGTSNG